MEESATGFALSVEQVAHLGINKLVVFSKSNQLAKCREERHQLYLQEIWTKLENRGYATHHKISDLTRSGGRGISGCLVVIDDTKYKLSVHEFTYKSHWQIVGLYDLVEWINKLEFQYQLFQCAELPATYIPQLPMENSDLIGLLKKYSDHSLESIFRSAKRQSSVPKMYEDLMEAKTSMDHLTVRRSSSISTSLSPSSVSSASSKVPTCSDSDTSRDEMPPEQVGRNDTPYSDLSPGISAASLPTDLSVTEVVIPIIPLSSRQPSRCSVSPFPRPHGNGHAVDEIEESSGFVASALPLNLASATPDSQRRRSHSDTSAPPTRRKRSKRARATRKSALMIRRNGKIKLVKGSDVLVRRAICLGKQKVVYEGQVYNVSKIAG
ncbi:hypothetical protein L486_06762 [Kwoniella mangroviensis CBS 10435]|uniref:Uncharacterized protein n=1 Tax=Kwoniella mangroviensis CBS 10435 TaxID=1331196 RepID=A0A1B9IKC3_9TREE|nr:hypothetical protein L486_06762 [Kwoniella mangroviensis CBS 10435]